MPKNTSAHQSELTVAHFADCGWREALDNVTQHENRTAIFLALSSAASQAETEERYAHGRVLQLLAFACAMHLDPTSRNEPFKPIPVGLDGQPSIIPRDFTEAHMDFFAQIIDDIDHPLLKGRLADLLWMHPNTRHSKFALTAIDCYRSIPLNSDTWASGALECLQRAVTLALSVRSAASGRLDQIRDSLSDAIDASTADDGFFPLKLADVLDTWELSEEQCASVATKLGSLALALEGQGDVYKERQYRQAAATWFIKAGDHSKSVAMTVAQAETWVKEAEARIRSDEQEFLVAMDCYEMAIKVYQTIPRAERAPYQIDQRIAELQRHHTECRENSQGQFKTFVSSSMDLADIAAEARNAVANKGLEDAMRAFAGLHTIPAERLRSLAVESLASSPIRAFMATNFLDSDNRVIGRHSGISGATPTEADETVVSAEMAVHYSWMIGAAVYGCILPALEVLNAEHIVGKSDFVQLARQSPIVPPGREILFGKALFYGFDHEFDTALHLLVPQIENMVRFHLKLRGAKTTNVNPEGIETENALSTLMDLPEATDIFGKDVAYEIRTLFCDRFGQNLRNNIAHGLLDDAQSQSVHTIYAWWYGLKLVFRAYWNAAHHTDERTEEESKSETADLDHE